MTTILISNCIFFTGNDCDKYSDRTTYSDIFESIPEKCKSLTKEPHILITARSIATTFIKLFSLYSDIYGLVKHSNFIKDDNIPLIDKCVRSYLSYLRTTFPDESIPLKLHIMEDHMLDMIMTYRYGMGLMGEQVK